MYTYNRCDPNRNRRTKKGYIYIYNTFIGQTANGNWCDNDKWHGVATAEMRLHSQKSIRGSKEEPHTGAFKDIRNGSQMHLNETRGL